MKKGEKISLIESKILEISHLMRVLDIKIKKFEAAYFMRSSMEFNFLKKDILQLQRKIQSIIK